MSLKYRRESVPRSIMDILLPFYAEGYEITYKVLFFLIRMTIWFWVMGTRLRKSLHQAACKVGQAPLSYHQITPFTTITVTIYWWVGREGVPDRNDLSTSYIILEHSVKSHVIRTVVIQISPIWKIQINCPKNFNSWTKILTRMHSSRMRTVRSSSRLLGGVCSMGVCSGGCLLRGCLLWVGWLLQGGGIPACTEADPHPRVDRQTGVKHYLRNFVADGKNVKMKIEHVECRITMSQFLHFKIDSCQCHYLDLSGTISILLIITRQ